MAYREILYSVADRIATITMNRPERLNAWTPDMGAELYDAVAIAANDEAIRVIILTGAGRGFCAGLDSDNLSDVSENERRKRIVGDGCIALGGSQRSDFFGLFTYFPSIGKPVIAAINGPVAGSGLVLALSCDLRFAADNAVFTTAFARRGLNAEHGIDWLLSRVVGVGNAQDLLLSARRVSAEEALRMHLINGVYPAPELMEGVRRYAQDIAQYCSPRSLRIIKRQVWDAQFLGLEECVRTGNREMLESFHSEDFREGIAHHIEKRAPRFTGR